MKRKKTWILTKRGLLAPKHRLKMGVRIWLFHEMLDRADWETGIVSGWKDKDIADDIDMPWRTLQEQRQQLDKDGYITCERGFHCQNIKIHKWVNPREYSGKVYNKSTESAVPKKKKSVPDSTGHTTRKSSTPTSSSQVIKKKRERDPLLDHPAITTYRDVVRRQVLVALRVEVATSIGDKPEDILRWEKHLKKWLGKGWNPGNIEGLLESFKSGSMRKPQKDARDGYTRASK